MNDFAAHWERLAPAFRQCLELAHQSLVAGGLAVGAVLTGASGEAIAAGRNRAYDPPGGSDALQRSPIAHAEMNALAGVGTGLDLGSCVLWSTQEPCPMCAAAATFTGVGSVRYIAPDPSWLASHSGEPSGSLASAALRAAHPTDHAWAVSANALFLCSVGRRAGTDHPTIRRNRTLEPETAAVAEAILSGAPDRVSIELPVTDLLGSIWPEVIAAASARQARTGGTPQ